MINMIYCLMNDEYDLKSMIWCKNAGRLKGWEMMRVKEGCWWVWIWKVWFIFHVWYSVLSHSISLVDMTRPNGFPSLWLKSLQKNSFHLYTSIYNPSIHFYILYLTGFFLYLHFPQRKLTRFFYNFYAVYKYIC